MNNKIDKNQKENSNIKSTITKSCFKLCFAGLLLCVVLVGIFTITNRMAANMPIGFPNFQESKFELLDQNGELRSPFDFAGRPIALFFGFTYCPDVCPTTLTTLNSAKEQIIQSQPNVKDLQILFVTIDPERDTPAQLKSYLSFFDENVTGLTGSLAEIKSMLSHFGVYAQKVSINDDYLYDHGSAVYLYHADGSFKGTIVHSEPSEFILEKLKSIL